ncbi:hypothetical protein PWG14_27675 [Chromobacterium amazonense]|uniref:hypothetical protein n=1 Tax=Chromobacterium amazonense TaxID=1382803 RepID=UPI00237E411B|nr:hypothetical protein [Chromobacterium amazonense]MDE1716250.1 hypothetical protein [Chromobacterium amazonense]
MQNEIYIVAGAAVTALAAFVTAKITTGIQLDIARLNAEKDVKLQKDRLHDDRLKNELVVEREKLDILHRTLSRIQLENSQTMSYFQSQSNMNVESFRARYLDNCERFHESMAIVDIYYPKMRDDLYHIYGQMNIFWGNQENLLRTDIKTNPDGWSSLLCKVLDAGEEISKRTRNLKDEITDRARKLKERIDNFSR